MTRLLLIMLSLLGAVGGGYYYYLYGENTIHGLTGPRFNQSVRTVPIGEFPLAGEIAGFNDYRMRARYVCVDVGKSIRLHDQAGRPAFSFVVNGTIDEYRSDAPSPIHHKAGDVTADGNIAQWWKNTSDEEVCVYVVDIYSARFAKGE